MKKNNAKKLNISVIILTHRKDNIFLAALTSSQFAQEVIIIDNDSNNNWTSLAKKFNFKIIKHETQITDFSKLRNQAIQKTKFDWIFFLDSDEILDHNSIAEIKSIIHQTKFFNAVVKRQDIFHNKIVKHGETKDVKLVRLIHKKYAKFVRPVHEIVATTGKTFQSQINIWHYAHHNIHEFINSINQYSEIEANYRLEVKDKNKTKYLYQALTFPTLKFINNYFLKLGFLDGIRGLIYALIMSLHSFAVRIKILEKLHNEKTL